ncbi:MAG TPA: hypothetical protein VD867_05800 [Burkholderiales bacterium]|nr:hypothetical protein [Burkholderiales bacterium]
MSEDPRVQFKPGTVGAELFGDLELFLFGDVTEGGPIATQDQFNRFVASSCHLMPDGRIMCYGRQIGTRDDLLFPVDVDQPAELPQTPNP